MAKIIHKRKDCIGCGSCVFLCPEFWEMDEDIKANLKGASKNKEENYELEVEDNEAIKNASECCPVQVIKIVK